MAAKTPSTITRFSSGDTTLLKCVFTDIDDGDTWTSGLKNVVNYTCQDSDNPTTQANAGVAASESAGVFTFYPAEDNKTAILNVYIRG